MHLHSSLRCIALGASQLFKRCAHEKWHRNNEIYFDYLIFWCMANVFKYDMKRVFVRFIMWMKIYVQMLQQLLQHKSLALALSHFRSPRSHSLPLHLSVSLCPCLCVCHAICILSESFRCLIEIALQYRDK